MRFTVVAVPPASSWRPAGLRTVATVGAFMSLGQFGLLACRCLGMPPGLAALVLQAQVVFTIVIAAVVLRERPSRAQVAGVALGVLGLAVVALGRGGHVPAAALVLCVAAGLSWGIGNVVSRASRAPGGLALTVWSATIVPVPLLALSLLVDGPAAVGHGLTHLGWDGVLSTVYTAGLCSLVGYAIFNRLLSKYPSGHVVPWVLSHPWSRWLPPGRCSARYPARPRSAARSCWSSACSSPNARHGPREQRHSILRSPLTEPLRVYQHDRNRLVTCVDLSRSGERP